MDSSCGIALVIALFLLPTIGVPLIIMLGGSAVPSTSYDNQHGQAPGRVARSFAHWRSGDFECAADNNVAGLRWEALRDSALNRSCVVQQRRDWHASHCLYAIACAAQTLPAVDFGFLNQSRRALAPWQWGRARRTR